MFFELYWIPLLCKLSDKTLFKMINKSIHRFLENSLDEMHINSNWWSKSSLMFSYCINKIYELQTPTVHDLLWFCIRNISYIHENSVIIIIYVAKLITNFDFKFSDFSMHVLCNLFYLMCWQGKNLKNKVTFKTLSNVDIFLEFHMI